jgi:hypothetical protein
MSFDEHVRGVCMCVCVGLDYESKTQLGIVSITEPYPQLWEQKFLIW